MDAVILAGGVTKGAFTAGALAVLFRASLPSPLAISHIVAASSGALNGAYLAAALHRGHSARVGDALRALWLEHADVSAFAPSLRGIATGEGFSTTDKLLALLRRYVRPGVGHVPVRLRVVLSTAAGELRPNDPAPATTFEHLADFHGHDFHTALRLEEVFAAVVASAAFPLAFLPPMVRIRGVATPCFDGGLCNNSPIKYAIEDPAVARVFVISPFPRVVPSRPEDARGAGLLTHLADILVNERLYRDLREARKVNRGLERLAQRVPVKTLRDAMLDAIGWGGRRPIEIVEIRPETPLSGNAFSGFVSRDLRKAYLGAGELAARGALGL